MNFLKIHALIQLNVMVNPTIKVVILFNIFLRIIQLHIFNQEIDSHL